MVKCKKFAYGNDEFLNVMENSDDITRVDECRDKKSKTNKDIAKLVKENDKIVSNMKKKTRSHLRKLNKTESRSKIKSLVKKYDSYLNSQKRRESILNYAKNIDKQKVILSEVCKKELSGVSKDTKQKLIKTKSKELKCKEEVKGEYKYGKKKAKSIIKKLKSKNNKNLLDVLF